MSWAASSESARTLGVTAGTRTRRSISRIWLRGAPRLVRLGLYGPEGRWTLPIATT